MQLLTVTAAGLVGCEGGRVEVYRRGTGQRARVWGDYEGTDERTGASYALGARGEAVLYVDEVVDVVAYGVDGDERRRWTEGGAASAHEYIGKSFTGTNLTTGVMGAQEHVTVQEVLNRARDSFGGLDWLVQKTVTTPPAVWKLSSLGVTVGTAWVSVKDPVYGARGDGVTDDTAAIQAAIDAVGAAGGGVVLVPPGVYRITSALSVSVSGVVLEGVGQPVIEQATAATSCVSATATGHRLTLRRMRLKTTAALGTSTAPAISMLGSDAVRIEDVVVNSFRHALRFNGTNRVSVIRCAFDVPGTTGFPVVETVAPAGGMLILDSSIDTANGAGVTLTDQLGVRIIGTGISSASGVALSVGGATGSTLLMSNTRLDGTVGLSVSGNSWVRESACDLGSVAPTLAVGAARAMDRWGSDPYPVGPDIASATDIAIPRVSLHSVFNVTGTTAITTISSNGSGDVANFPPGKRITLRFAAALTLTHGSGNIRLNGATNFTTSAGDVIELQLVNGLWYEIGRANI